MDVHRSSSARRRLKSLFAALLAVLFAAVFVAVLLLAGRADLSAQFMAGLSIIIILVHAILALGALETATFLTICLIVTFAIENLGTATGIPFGRYHFVVGADFPHVGAIPVIVGLLYFGMGYPSWIIAGLLLRRGGAQPRDAYDLVAFPLVATFVMVQWDTVMDPPNATLGGLWIWHDGGGFFGVPLSNFLGWYLTVWMFFSLYASTHYLRRHRRAARPARPTVFWLVPILLYLGAGLCWISPYLRGATGSVRDGAGRVWQVADIRESTVIVMMATMLATTVLALLRLWAEGREPDANDR